MKIANFDISKKIFIVAEAGVNHEGDFETALRMVEAAKEAGADAVKFQTYVPGQFISRSIGERFERVSRFALSPQQFVKLAAHARKTGILFFSTPLDTTSADVLAPHVPLFKIASGEMTFRPLIRHIASKKKPIIFSTGTASLPEIKRTLGWIKTETSASFVRSRVAVLHCISCYPAAFEDVNLAAICTLAKELGVAAVGYSDHTVGIEVAPIAAAVGARIIEKHFTLGREGKVFRDHFLSADPSEFRQMVASIRRTELLLGRPGKPLGEAERANVAGMRRGIAASRDLSAGETVRAADLLFVRPQGDFSYEEAEKVIGKKLRSAVACGHLIRKQDLGGRR